MPSLGDVIESVFFKKNQRKRSLLSVGDGGHASRDGQRSVLALSPSSLSPTTSTATSLLSPTIENPADAEMGAKSRRTTGRFALGRMPLTAVRSSTASQMFDLEIDRVGDDAKSRRSTLSVARFSLRSNRREHHNGSHRQRNSESIRGLSEGWRRSEIVCSSERRHQSRSVSLNYEPDLEALLTDMSKLRREVKRLKAAQSDGLFEVAQRSQASRSRGVQQEAELYTPFHRNHDEGESEKLIAHLRSELAEAKVFAQKWAEAAAKAEAERNNINPRNDAKAITQQDFQATGETLTDLQNGLAVAKAEAGDRRQQPSIPPTHASIGWHHHEQARGVSAIVRDEAQSSSLLIERRRSEDLEKLHLESEAAVLTALKELRAVKVKLVRAEAECASWKERFAAMQTSLQDDVQRYKECAESAESQLEELRCHAKTAAADVEEKSAHVLFTEEERRGLQVEDLQLSCAREVQEELILARLRQADEEVRRAEEARVTMVRQVEEMEASRMAIISQNRALEMQLSELTLRCRVCEDEAAQKDKEIASLTVKMNETLASAEESMRVMEDAAAKNEWEVDGLRSQLRIADLQAKHEKGCRTALSIGNLERQRKR